MAAYVNQVIDLGQKLRATGFQIDDTWIGSLLLAGLPERFAPMIMGMEHSGIDITADSVKTKLLDMDTGVSGAGGSAFVGKAECMHNFRDKKKVTSNDKNNAVKDLSKIKCYNCKQTGHYKNKCPMLNSVGNKSYAKNNSKNAFSAVFLSGNFNKSEWYIDSGASAHMTANEKWITDKSDKQQLQEIMVANQEKIKVTCSGNVNVKTVVGKNIYDIVVQDVLCIPSLATNLLSVSKMIENGNKVIFQKDQCKIFNKIMNSSLLPSQ